ncbi:MAG: glycosyltransferase family 4 protein [Planctomycetaceae bacterium]|nr:glycosyltransferase family 4 protein [Planctomycetaceae bacterium]
MRILYLVGGNDVLAGGATVRDSAFVRGLQDGGHDVIPVSLYGPASVEGESGYSRLFLPLEHNTIRRYFPRLAKVPSTLGLLLRRPTPVVSMTSIAVSGRRNDVRGPLAVSLLSGANKMQRREFSRLMELLDGQTPDAVILSNTMLSGLTDALRSNLGCPIFCLTQRSDRVIEALDEPYRSDARKLVRKNARLFRMVICSSRYFAIRTTESLALPAARIRVVPPGVDAEALKNPAPRRRLPFTIGYLAPIRKDKGLDILVDAVESLVRDTSVEPELWVAGRVEDERYWNRLHRRLEGKTLASRHRIYGSLGGHERRDFFEGLSVFVVSSREPESRATHVLEAMAAGVPVIGPACGIIPEIFQYANGGLLVSSEAPAWMFAQALELLASMPDTADEMGRVGSEGIAEYFSIGCSAEKLAVLIEESLAQDPK